jgi:peptidoglycan/LPS O-acetylase OafA/YrhL
MASIPYRPEVDGLRAFAIAIVVIFHLAPGLLPGGYLGVDIFFVISGYLITSIILAEYSAGRFSLREFWARRIRRIMPAAAFLIAAVLLAAVVLDYPQRALSMVGRQAVASLAFVANYAMKVIAGDYWAPASETLAFLHHWSLAVEEQFYFVYPLLLIGLLCLDKRRVFWALALLGVASLAAYMLVSRTNPPSAFFLPQYRVWELLAGCLLAFVPIGQRRVGVEYVGAVLMVGAVIGAPFLDVLPGLAACVAVAGAAAYIHAASGLAVPSRLLSANPAVTIGKASYSLYLWHWPCIVMAKTMADLLERETLAWVSLPMMALGTIVSYRWVEKMGRQMRSPFIFAAVTLVGLMAFSVAATLNKREPSTPGVNRPSWLAAAYDCVRNPPIALIGDTHVGFDLPDENINPRRADGHLTGVDAGARGSAEQWCLLGDSHALMWAAQLDRHASSAGKALRIYAGIGLSPLLTESPGAGLDKARRSEFNQARLAYIASSRPELVIIAMRWDSAQRAGQMPLVDQLLSEIHRASPSSRIILIGQPPVARISVNGPQWVAWRSSWGAQFDTAPLADVPATAESLRHLRTVSDQQKHVGLWDPAPLLLIGNRVRVVVDSQILIRDDDHLSEQGAAYVSSALGQFIDSRLK